MPFDALTPLGGVVARARPRTIAERIGLIPVPMEVLTAHKAKMLREFRAVPANAWRRNLAKWMEYDEHFFQPRTTMLGWAAHCFGPVPAEVHDIINKTDKRLREEGVTGKKTLGWFYTDPYVLIKWRGRRVPACLAIWDKGEVIAIAKLMKR